MSCDILKLINAVTPCLFVIPDSSKLEGLKWESEFFVLGGEYISIRSCAPHGDLFGLRGDKPSLVNPNRCRLPTGGWWCWRLHDARER